MLLTIRYSQIDPAHKRSRYGVNNTEWVNYVRTLPDFSMEANPHGCFRKYLKDNRPWTHEIDRCLISYTDRHDRAKVRIVNEDDYQNWLHLCQGKNWGSTISVVVTSFKEMYREVIFAGKARVTEQKKLLWFSYDQVEDVFIRIFDFSNARMEPDFLVRIYKNQSTTLCKQCGKIPKDRLIVKDGQTYTLSWRHECNKLLAEIHHDRDYGQFFESLGNVLEI